MKRGKYCRKVVRAGRTVDVQFTYPTRFGEQLTRAKHKEGSFTALDVENYNNELAIRKLTQILNENFSPDDWWVTLHYELHNRPTDIETAKKQLSKFFTELRKLYKDCGVELRYVRTTAFGDKGALHHHIVIPKGVNTREITKLWKEIIKASQKARPPQYTALYSDGEYSVLAAYICRQGENNTAKEKNMRKWTCSRNIKKPEPAEVITVDKVKWKEPPIAWPGYYIETDSIRAGINPITNRPYLFYRMVKLLPDFTCYDNSGKRLIGKIAVKYYRENNKEFIRQKWLDLNPEGEVIFKSEGGRADCRADARNDKAEGVRQDE